MTKVYAPPMEKVQDFLDEYNALTKKHGLCLKTVGEEGSEQFAVVTTEPKSYYGSTYQMLSDTYPLVIEDMEGQHNLTNRDSTNVWVAVTPTCHRAMGRLMHLYRENGMYSKLLTAQEKEEIRAKCLALYKEKYGEEPEPSN